MSKVAGDVVDDVAMESDVAGDVAMEAPTWHMVKWLKKLNPDIVGKRDKGKFYRFHEDYGHTTNECRQLKDEIERLIRDIWLIKLTRDGWDERRATTSRNKEIITEKDESLIRVINVIASGPNIGKAGNKRPVELSSISGPTILSVDRNELSKETITIGLKDNEVKQPHFDPLVVSMQINKYTVR
ncbi:uncharacterized protein LOC131176668 [Hevea brasiliensis]|uniref:uncharacterized protein LOC131176668 n=1 Tax=Hevea brasiliensis TaxID=3981 RepID=UPI0025DBC0FD|nr:uncharacterized protein LOC131176668 [Hevea brasiliensis]